MLELQAMGVPRLCYCLFSGPGAGVGKVVAVQDSFGSQFHLFSRPYNVGEIVRYMKCRGDERRVDLNENGSVLNVKILRRVHPNTVYAVLRCANRVELELGSGYWYEVHGD